MAKGTGDHQADIAAFLLCDSGLNRVYFHECLTTLPTVALGIPIFSAISLMESPCSFRSFTTWRSKTRLGRPETYAVRFRLLDAGVHPLPDQFPLQLGKSSHDLKQEVRHRVGLVRVDSLGNGDEPDSK